jgi:hypothetical protein
MTEYANRTKVPADKTRIEIEVLMRKRGADQFLSASDQDRAMLAFRLGGRHMRFVLPLSDTRNAQHVRSRWRALLLVIRAKLEAIDTGILTLEEAFIGDTVMPDKRTVAEILLPQIESAYQTGKMPPLLPYYGDREP